MEKQEGETRVFMAWEWSVILRERRGFMNAEFETRFDAKTHTKRALKQ